MPDTGNGVYVYCVRDSTCSVLQLEIDEAKVGLLNKSILHDSKSWCWVLKTSAYGYMPSVMQGS